jgi:uncharacterized SAM-binding protein YcdF (DUF218 family)
VIGRWLTRAAKALLVVAAVMWIYFLITLVQVYQTGRSDETRQVDAIVVMGAAQYDGTPSAQLAARLDHVVTLWDRGVAGVVVVTGGNRPGDRFTEASSSAAYLIERGVPDDAILREDQGTTSYESLQTVAQLLADRGLSTVLVVTDPYHSLRSRLIAEEVGLTAFVSPTPTTVITGRVQLKRELKEAGGVAVGRLIGFGRLSEITG